MRILLNTLLIFSCLCHGFLLGQNSLRETVVVTAYSSPVAFENLARGVTVINREQIRRLPVQSVADLLRYVASIDVRSRSPFGVQTDFSARGAGFGQTLVLINGLRINDSQSGHHNGDLPVALSDVERVEILHGTGSSVYGADAFGATINVVTRRDGESQVRISAGEYGYIEGEARTVFELGGLNQSVSWFGNRSSGFMFDRDFHTVGLTLQTEFSPDSHLYFSHLRKEFGANGFYGPSPSKEWTNTTLASFQHAILSSGKRRMETRVYYRTHGDHFLWDIRRPGFFENEHRTHAAGVSLKSAHLLAKRRTLTWGGEVGGDWIGSNNLGHHSYGKWAIYAELQQQLGHRVSLVPGLRFDRYSNFGSAFSPSVSASWWVHSRLKLRSSAGHAFRTPTFTELYYTDPNHRASAELQPERARELEVGADWVIGSSWLVQASLFLRWDQNAIDWVRESADQTWETTNIRALQTRGLEVGLQKAIGGGLGIVQAQYTNLNSETDSLDVLSKYVLDFARHSFSAFGTLQLPGNIHLGQGAHYKVRADGRNYWVLNQKWMRDFGRFSVFLEVSNLLDTEYEEIRGVVLPGRWIRGGLELRNLAFH